jgi:hypothetical protein
MTRKTKQTKTKKAKAKKPTPFADAGAITGQRLGSMFNMPYLKGIGKWLGSGIGHIMGSGDYTLLGPQPEYNVLANGNQIPKFNSNKQTNIICHREYIGDISGTTAFTNRAYPLNPGMAATFPWLSTIAQNYQEYKFHGLIFEFRPLITDFVTSGAPGVVVMATNYNADAPVYISKQQMENSEYAVSVKPTENLMHGIECAVTQTVLPQLYTRSAVPPAGQDLRLYDQGLFQFASQGNPLQLLGELWVSYCVEFFKPVIANEVGGNILSAYIERSGVTPSAALGTIGVINRGDLNVTMTGNSLSFDANTNDLYLIVINWNGTGAPLTIPTPVVANGELIKIYQSGTQDRAQAPSNGVSSPLGSIEVVVKCNTIAPSNVTVSMPGTGAYPTGAVIMMLMITQFSAAALP